MFDFWALCPVNGSHGSSCLTFTVFCEKQINQIWYFLLEMKFVNFFWNIEILEVTDKDNLQRLNFTCWYTYTSMNNLITCKFMQKQRAEV